MSAAPPALLQTSNGHGLSRPGARMGSVIQMIQWSVAAADPVLADRLAREAGLSGLLARLLVQRGVREVSEASAFLRPGEAGLHDASLLLGAEAAADLLVWTARRGGRVVVFGDYDVDGVTAVAQLRAALRRVGADASAFIPHRLRDGYGLKPETVRRVLRELNPAAIVTVDCGITAVEGVSCAREAGVEVIVTDHHLVPETLPPGAVVVNPRQPGCPYPFKDLAASAIAMKISEAVARRAGVPLSRESLLRAACLGTIADMVPLTGENRTIAAMGLAALADSRAPGLRALLAEAGLTPDRAPSAEEVAFRIAPRLNAAGRLDTAALALSLFDEPDAARAAAVARELSARNAERQALERRVVAEARARVDSREDPAGALILEADPAWHRGVLGIAASRLAREYNRPVLLFGQDGDRASGSGRSIPGVSLHGILRELSGYFIDFGGHDQAVGASLPAGRLEAFRSDALALFAARVPAESLTRLESADAELAVDDLTEDLARELEALEPHGTGNSRPVFLSRAVAAAGPFLPAGDSGLRGRLRCARGGLRCVAWQPDERLEALGESGRPFDIHYRLSGGRGGYGLQVEIVGIRPAACEVP